MALRTIKRRVQGVPTQDGAGVSLTRMIGTQYLRHADPFLMLDRFHSDKPGDYIAGFPSHPHRGFETVTYMLAGKMRHRDNTGREGVIQSGGVQWMTAGRGIVHEEMPEQESGLMSGFQLWVNLPAKDKMMAPRYQEFDPDVIPEVELEHGSVKVVAGEFNGVQGPVGEIAIQPTFLDIALTGGELNLDIPDSFTTLVHPYEGELVISNDQVVAAGSIVELGAGEAFTLRGEGKAIVLAGKPINEPIVQYGPFVMNKPEEIEQAIRDFQSGRF
ncbi:pirin family protein [Salinibius halmophilus]|uniref:pirin family protein n=1 Tax=Salinibius halmophilus TaxID=1853216 RepID=UPI000E66B8EF|nr:pirin family protein [Salinibius halmophilus]